jgi:predicted dehydrogenase
LIHIGLIGGGSITSTHARAVAAIAGAQVVALYGSNHEKIEQLCRQFGGSAYTDFHSFLGHPALEMVIIGSPSGLHAEHGIAAAQRGLHVLVEKPIDVTSNRSDALIAECERAGVKLGVIFQDRFKPGIRRLKQLIIEGNLGKVLLADARVKWYRPPEYYSSSRWRGSRELDGGVLMNQGVHTADLLLWLLGDVNNVVARTGTLLHSIDAEDTAIALLEFSSGAMGVLQATTAAYPGYARRVEVTGTEGTAILENDQLITTGLRNPLDDLLTEVPDQNASASSPLVGDIRGHQRAIEDFIAAIRGNGAPACDGREGRRSVMLIEKIYRVSRKAQRMSR